MINTHDILETIQMIDQENLDVRTITMGISLLDCADSDAGRACGKIYDKICRCAGKLVKTGEDISKEYGIPIINKRISVTPVAMVAAASGGDPVRYALALDRAAESTGVNFIGGYSALVHKGFGPGDLRLIESIPEALSRTERYAERSLTPSITPKSISPLSSFSLTAVESPLKNLNFTSGCALLTAAAARITSFAQLVSPPPILTSPQILCSGALISAIVLS